LFKEEIIGILGAIASYVLAYVGFSMQVESLQFIFSFLAGAFTTYVFQHRLQVEFEKRKIKREDAITMRNKIYGPIFREMSMSLESVESGKGPEWEIVDKLKEMMRNNFFFFRMRKDLKSRFYALVERLYKYRSLHYATRTMILKEIKEAVEKDYRLDIGETIGRVFLRLNIDDLTVVYITLEQCLLRRMNLRDFIAAKRKEWGEDITRVEVRIGGEHKTFEDFESLYESVFDELEGDPFFQKEEKLRKSVVKELETFLGQIRDFITVQ